MFKLKYFLLAFALLALDLFIYLILGIGLMAYEDTYTPSKVELYSWASMSDFDKSVVIGLNIWNIVNVVTILYIGNRIYKNVKLKKLKLYGNNQSNNF